ncbi:hypothetical protein SAY86_020643 [Trapa natans]|uniref:GLTSCR protein conserved domain-containing protein n=1 Tax=Trapa natans TaxID=22666 RepID=A0AAN7LQ32_TRANT|nr:hypothetical protein SAY86_020643 [Trapa natans]
MEDARTSAQQYQQQQQHQQMILQQQQQMQRQQHQHQHQQQQQQRQLLLLQQLQKQQQQAAAMSRFPSNIDAHLRPSGLAQRLAQQNPNIGAESASSNLQQQKLLQQQLQQQKQIQQQQHQQQQQQQQKAIRPEGQMELQMAYQDAWKVCHPDFKRPFSSLEDACERLLPYHVIADYEAEEDDRILDSDTTGQMLSRSQQWDHNIAAKVAEFTSTFEKQVLAFNIINRKRGSGEFRSEERLMIEQALLQEERRATMDLKAEIESQERAGREAQARIAAVHAEQTRAESQRGPIRAAARGGSDIPLNHGLEEQDKNPDEMMNGWANNGQRDEKEPSEDFLNDEEADNGDTAGQDDWRGVGEFDLNAR